MREPAEANTDHLNTVAARLAHVRKQAVATFEDEAKAERWLNRPLSELDNKAPIDLLLTEDGSGLVENILAKIAWGAAS